MKVYIDVYYYTDKDTDKEYARTVAGIFETYDDITFKDIVITRTDNIALYEPGNFYKRELPCIVDVLKECWKRVQKDSKFSLLFSLINQETKRFKYDN